MLDDLNPAETRAVHFMAKQRVATPAHEIAQRLTGPFKTATELIEGSLHFRRTLLELHRRGLVELDSDLWVVTQLGLQMAEQLQSNMSSGRRRHAPNNRP